MNSRERPWIVKTKPLLSWGTFIQLVAQSSPRRRSHKTSGLKRQKDRKRLCVFQNSAHLSRRTFHQTRDIPSACRDCFNKASHYCATYIDPFEYLVIIQDVCRALLLLQSPESVMQLCLKVLHLAGDQSFGRTSLALNLWLTLQGVDALVRNSKNTDKGRKITSLLTTREKTLKQLNLPAACSK